MQENRPVMIVGAGPTGLTAAMELSRLGVPVRLVDRYQTPPVTSRALAVQARTLELCSQRGLSDEMLRLGNKVLAMTLYGDGKTLGTIDFQQIRSRFNYMLLLSQSEVERILRGRLNQQGVHVECQTEMIAFSQTGPQEEGSGVKVILRKACGTMEEVEASYLIDAEGAHSTIRHTLGIPFEGKSFTHSYALADLHIDGDIPQDQLIAFLSEAGLIATFPMGERRYRIIASESAHFAPQSPDPDLPYMEKLWRQGSHIPVRLYKMVWSSRFRVNSRMLNQLRHQRVFFGGDSAHIHSPAGGQGMNTGIQDMINLGWKIALVYKGQAKPELLDTYDTERVPVIRALVNTTETATDVFDSESRLTHTLLKYALPIALSFRATGEKGAEIVSETQINYRRSPLTISNSASGSLQAGDRLPDLMVKAQSGDETLASLLDPSRFTVFSIGEATRETILPSWANEWNQRSISAPADEGDAKAFMNAIGDSVLLVVRPDGYLLWKSSGHGNAPLQEWASAWLT